MLRLKFSEIEKGTYHSYAKQFLGECDVFERPPRKKYALKFAEASGLDPWPFWEIVKQVLEQQLKGGDPMAKAKEPRRANMKTGSTLVLLSIFFLFTASFADNMETASDQQIGLIKKGFFEPVTVLKSAAIIQRTGRY